MGKKRTTIYDIAKEINLTANTVSRVLNNKGYISEKTRARVLKAAKDLNYVPNDLARSLKSSETRQILLAVPYIKESFNFDLIAAIQNVVQEKGYSLMLMYTESDEKKELRAIESLMRNHADGLILATVNISDKVIQRIRNVDKPCVVNCFCRYNKELGNLPFDYVCVDTKKGIYDSTKHLINQGHVDISYVGPEIDILEGAERYAGFLLAMEEAGLPINEEYIITGEHTELFGYESGRKLVNLSKLPTAICAGTDLIVLGLYRAFEQNNIVIPKDISIIGMDNIDICTLVRPRISSVSIAQNEIGLASANIIIDRLAGNSGKEFKNITFEPRLIIRESSLNYYREV